jgi:pimeloyl-ACP methyl ester carboxylesterase
MLFAPFLQALGGRFETTVVRYNDERSFDDYVESAARALPERDAILIAESFSGPVALALGARHSTKIAGIVLCASFARSPFRMLLRSARSLPVSWLEPSPLQPLLLRWFCFNGVATPLLVQALAAVTSVPAPVMHARLACLATVDARPLLQQITAPVLYLQALRDRIVSARFGRALTAQLPNAEIMRIDGPHLLLQTCPRECAQAIATFISRCTSRSRHLTSGKRRVFRALAPTHALAQRHPGPRRAIDPARELIVPCDVDALTRHFLIEHQQSRILVENPAFCLVNHLRAVGLQHRPAPQARDDFVLLAQLHGQQRNPVLRYRRRQ